MSITGSCHCGNISWELSVDPEWVTECNCSLCRRIGALWILADLETAKVTAARRASFQYVHGPETLALHVCGTCGCVTHRESLAPDDQGEISLNARMVDPILLQYLDLRHFDGADTWQYLD